jgi:hypothetical protein
MSDQGIKSRPTYAPLRPDPHGRRHLLVCDRAALPIEALHQGVERAHFNERWSIVSDSRAIPSSDPANFDHQFRSEQHLLIALRRRLDTEAMGFRLYAVGTEPFLWAIYSVAVEFGAGPDEIALFATGTGARRVFCNHCRTVTAGVMTNIVVCCGCGAHLFVRDHFSRRLNAFAGVQIDAEVPGEVPATEELYR